jgi:hypothetical protein
VAELAREMDARNELDDCPFLDFSSEEVVSIRIHPLLSKATQVEKTKMSSGALSTPSTKYAVPYNEGSLQRDPGQANDSSTQEGVLLDYSREPVSPKASIDSFSPSDNFEDTKLASFELNFVPQSDREERSQTALDPEFIHGNFGESTSMCHRCSCDQFRPNLFKPTWCGKCQHLHNGELSFTES